MQSEKEFLEELNVYKNEVLLALKYLYTELAIHEIAHKDKKILKTLNYSPTFWNTTLSALQQSTFLTLGRIFDIGSKHSIHKLYKLSEQNKYLFTKKTFRERWERNEDRTKINTWLESYLKTVYVPTDADFRKFKKTIKKLKNTYENIYRPIRDHFGHKIYVKNEEVKVLFDKVQIKELEKFCVTLENLHEVLWQLFHNGRGPMALSSHKKHSTQNILKNLYKQDYPGTSNTQIIREVRCVLNLLKTGQRTTEEERHEELNSMDSRHSFLNFAL